MLYCGACGLRWTGWGKPNEEELCPQHPASRYDALTMVELFDWLKSVDVIHTPASETESAVSRVYDNEEGRFVYQIVVEHLTSPNYTLVVTQQMGDTGEVVATIDYDARHQNGIVNEQSTGESDEQCLAGVNKRVRDAWRTRYIHHNWKEPPEQLRLKLF